MVCIYCGGLTAVSNSRPQRQLNQVWRRRTCTACNSTFTTHEKVDLGATIMVHDKAGQLTPFSRDLLFISIYESCKHRPTAIADADSLTQTIIRALHSSLTGGKLDRQTITLVAHKTLDRFDKAAATMYAAYHPLRA